MRWRKFFTKVVDLKWRKANKCRSRKSIITYESSPLEPYYPVNDAKNQELYEKYSQLADKEPNVIFGGRLAEYKYYDMDKVIRRALDISKKLMDKE